MTENNDFDEVTQESSDCSQPSCSSTPTGDDCCTLSGGKGWKTVIFILVVVAAGVVLAHSLIAKSNSAIDQTQPLFATIPPESNPHMPSLPDDTITKEVSDKAETTLWGQELDSLASLNKVAADTDAVFVFLAADSRQGDQTITSQIEAAAKTLQSNGIRISAFTLKKDSLDYTQLAKQSSIPCVLAMVKSRGMSGVSGEITDTKLVQAFVTASRPTSGCSPAGCGPTGCGPTPAKPGPRR
jgi:hypothetical protein